MAEKLPEEPPASARGPITPDEILDAREILLYWERDLKALLIEINRRK
jgi:hypothetical protein